MCIRDSQKPVCRDHGTVCCGDVLVGIEAKGQDVYKRQELVKVQSGQLILDEFIQAPILPALQKLPVQITLNAVMDQIGIDLDELVMLLMHLHYHHHMLLMPQIGFLKV